MIATVHLLAFQCFIQPYFQRIRENYKIFTNDCARGSIISNKRKFYARGDCSTNCYFQYFRQYYSLFFRKKMKK